MTKDNSASTPKSCLFSPCNAFIRSFIVTPIIAVEQMVLVSAALICGVATCLAAPPTPKWCSYGFDDTDEPAELVFFRSGPEFRLKGKTLKLADNPFWVELMTFATIDYVTEGIEYHDRQIIIYKDRVFWPCEKK